MQIQRNLTKRICEETSETNYQIYMANAALESQVAESVKIQKRELERLEFVNGLAVAIEDKQLKTSKQAQQELEDGSKLLKEIQVYVAGQNQLPALKEAAKKARCNELENMITEKTVIYS